MIKTLRKRRLMTANQLALKSGVSRDSITRYENGKREPKVGDALKIARALGCTVEELVEDEGGLEAARAEVNDSPVRLSEPRAFETATGGATDGQE